MNQPVSSAAPTTFPTLAEPEPHRARGQEILSRHPDLRRYRGTNPYGFLVIVSMVALQVACAAMIAQQAWWAILALSIFVGAFANNALWMMIHECSHNLMFRKPSWNIWAGIAANLPQLVPGSVAFQRYHLQHHQQQGIYELDTDIPRRWEAALVGNSALRKTIWLFLLPLVLLVRPLEIKGVRLVDRWFLINVVVQVAFDALILYALGPGALAYFFLSFLFSLGLHPLGGRWIQEHYLFHPPQDTYSYYGPLNRLAFNIGYHNEHHDFPWVPWNRLPKIRSAVPEIYDSLAWHRSWTGLVYRFVADRRISLFSRLVRTPASTATVRAHPAGNGR